MRIVLSELDNLGKTARLPESAAEALAASGLVEVRRTPEDFILLPRGKVGSVRHRDWQVDVLPKQKIGLTRLLFLLGYAADPGFREGLVYGDAAADLWPAIAETLGRMARTALAPGVIQGYRHVDEALRTVRGRIRIGDQISRRPGMTIPVEVSYDEYTPDIAENQILRTALRRLLVVPRLADGLRASMAHLDGKLETVSVLPAGVPPPAWRATRLNERYVPALRLAEAVLANTSRDLGDGDVPIASFVVDPAKVFEEFVGTALREALAEHIGRVQLQYPAFLDVGRDVNMYVDAVWLRDDIPVTVLDAKYKAADPNGAYPNADLYQMLAYCTALRVETAWLVYAGPGKPRKRRVVNSPVTIVEYPIDLARSPAEVLASMSQLAEIIGSL